MAKKQTMLLDVSKLTAAVGRRFIARTGGFAGAWGRGDTLGEALRNALSNGATLRDSFLVYETDRYATVNEMGGINRPRGSAPSVLLGVYFAEEKHKPKDARYLIVAYPRDGAPLYRTGAGGVGEGSGAGIPIHRRPCVRAHRRVQDADRGELHRRAYGDD